MRLERQHAGARQKSGIELEGRVLRRRADQNDRAVFHDRQEAVLLGAVEAMDLVDEQAASAGRTCAARGPIRTLFFRSATPEKIAEICSKARPASPESSRATVVLPVPGGPQKIIEPSEPACDHAREHPVLAGQVRLSGDLRQASAAAAVGQRSFCAHACAARLGRKGRSSEELTDALAVALDLDAPQRRIVLDDRLERRRSCRSACR